MKNESLYRRTVDILYDAYFNDTLEHANCWACSTGNIIAANMGLRVEINPTDNKGLWLDENLDKVNPAWYSVFCTTVKIKFWNGKKAIQKIDFEKYEGEAALQIKASGYTPLELSKLEWAFESAKRGKSNDEFMYNGLISVLEELKSLHEVDNNDCDIQKFTDHFNKVSSN